MQKRWVAARILISYFLLYLSRNLISTASVYLFDTNVISRNTYAIMQTSSYVIVFICKFTSGFIVKQFGITYNRLIFGFLMMPLIGTIAMLTLSFTGAAEKKLSSSIIAAVFIVVYCITKILAAFARIVTLELFYQIYKKADTEKNNMMGKLNTSLQVISCIGDASGKFALGFLLQNTSLLKYSQILNYPRWCLPIIILSTISGLGIPYILSLFTVRKNNQVDEKDTCINVTSFRHRPSLADNKKANKNIKSNLRFYICCLISFINSIVAVSMGSYGSHYMRYSLNIESIKVPQYDAVTPVVVLCGIALSGFAMNKYRTKTFRVTMFIIVPMIATIILLTLLIFVDLSKNAKLFLYFAHQFCFYAFQNLIDGAYLMQIVPQKDASVSTGIVSAVGYLGSLVVPFTIVNYSTHAQGWVHIMLAVLFLESVLFVPAITLQIIDLKKMRFAKPVSTRI